MSSQRELTGICVSRTRRSAAVILDNGDEVKARLTTKIEELTTGDRVTLQEQGEDFFLLEILPRQNFLAREYRSKRKILAANLDRLLLVTAPGPLFQTSFIDRVLVTCEKNSIPVTIVVNKSDLTEELKNSEPFIEIYEQLSIPTLRNSAVAPRGMQSLKDLINDQALSTVALAGVSGVGKTTILNRIIPFAQEPTGEVSTRTGQGKQTTTQAWGHKVPRDGNTLFLIDLPGVQNFGVTSLSEDELRTLFPEFRALAGQCEYLDCKHRDEQECEVKRALNEGSIAESRYISYCLMLEEIERAREY